MRNGEMAVIHFTANIVPTVTMNIEREADGYIVSVVGTGIEPTKRFFRENGKSFFAEYHNGKIIRRKKINAPQMIAGR